MCAYRRCRAAERSYRRFDICAVLGIFLGWVGKSAHAVLGVHRSTGFIVFGRHQFRIARAPVFRPRFISERENRNPFLGDDAFEVFFELCIFFPFDRDAALR